MAVLQKIRDKAGVAVSIIIAIALLSFIIDPGTLDSAMSLMSSKNDVGNIAGKSISYADFQEDVEQFTTIHTIMTGSSVQNEEAQKQIRDAAWQNLVDRYLFIKNARAAGINVGEAERLDLLMGENPSPIVSSSPAFAGEDGNFSAEKVVEFVQNLSSDQSGQANTYWNYVQRSVTLQQYYLKYGALFTNSAMLNALQIADELEAGNSTANVDFVLKPFSFQQDTTIVVPEADIKKFYDTHKKDFKQGDSRDIEYVLFEVTPSQKDIEQCNVSFMNSYDEFATADNAKAFLLKNSEAPYSDYWYKDGELNTISSDINDFVFKNGQGVSPVFTEGNTLRAAKVVESAMISDSVYVKHILLQGSSAKATADSLLAVLKKGGDFAVNAAAYSVDKDSMADGQIGNIGWLTQTYMIPGFESVITAQTGVPFILNTQYGTHIVEVAKKTAPVVKKKVAILEKTALASKQTFNERYAEANNFATLAGGKLEGFRKAADSLKVIPHVQAKITEAMSSYSSVDQAKEVTRWAFDAKKGKCSAIITVNQSYFFIVALTGINKEGYTPLKDVEPMIKQHLYSQLNSKKQCELVAGQIAGKTDIAEVASILGTEVSNVPDMTFSTMGARQNEPALTGAAQKAALGKIAGPVAGNMGVYVLKVNSREKGSFFTEEDAKSSNSQKVQYTARMIVPVMMQDADVKDNRARFY